MKKIIILFFILLPQVGGAADCVYFTIDNEMKLSTELEWNINNNGACSTESHASGKLIMWGIVSMNVDVQHAIIGLKAYLSWDGWYHYHVGDYPNASVVTVYGTVDDWHADWTAG